MSERQQFPSQDDLDREANQSSEGARKARLVRFIRHYAETRYQDTLQRSPDFVRIMAEKGSPITPIGIIRFEFERQVDKHTRQSELLRPVLRAFDAIAYDLYLPGSNEETAAGYNLSTEGVFDRNPIIKLPLPQQALMLEALTEAFNIPHEPGQREIPIPEHLRRYKQWSSTQEYNDRVAEARAKRTLQK